MRHGRGGLRRAGLPWIPPELREDRGEVQAAVKGALPALVTADQLLSDLHTHSTWSDGRTRSGRWPRAADRRADLKVLAVTDHSVSLGIANGLSVERLKTQRAEIDAVQAELGNSLRLLQGAEIEIKADGGLDYDDEVLAGLDIVVASLHTGLRQPRQQVTERLPTRSATQMWILSATPPGA